MEDISKLPKWAQRKITSLEADLRHANELVSEGPEDSNTFLPDWSGPDRPLGKDIRVQFRMDDYGEQRRHQDYIDVRVDRDERGPYIYIMGGQSLTVEPGSSNTVRIRQWR